MQEKSQLQYSFYSLLALQILAQQQPLCYDASFCDPVIIYPCVFYGIDEILKAVFSNCLGGIHHRSRSPIVSHLPGILSVTASW